MPFICTKRKRSNIELRKQGEKYHTTFTAHRSLLSSLAANVESTYMLSPTHLHPCSSIRERNPHSTAFATSEPEHTNSSSSPTYNVEHQLNQCSENSNANHYSLLQSVEQVRGTGEDVLTEAPGNAAAISETTSAAA